MQHTVIYTFGNDNIASLCLAKSVFQSQDILLAVHGAALQNGQWMMQGSKTSYSCCLLNIIAVQAQLSLTYYRRFSLSMNGTIT